MPPSTVLCFLTTLSWMHIMAGRTFPFFGWRRSHSHDAYGPVPLALLPLTKMHGPAISSLLRIKTSPSLRKSFYSGTSASLMPASLPFNVSHGSVAPSRLIPSLICWTYAMGHTSLAPTTYLRHPAPTFFAQPVRMQRLIVDLRVFAGHMSGRRGRWF